MKKFDSFGLELSNFQGKLFEMSLTRYDCSTLVFLRRFKGSNVAYKLDIANKNILLDYNESFYELDMQYPESSCGKIRYSREVLFWMGYIYRYISYTREITTRQAFNLISPKELSSHYYVYHTQSEEWVIDRILDLKGKNSDTFSKNERLKKLLYDRYAVS